MIAAWAVLVIVVAGFAMTCLAVRDLLRDVDEMPDFED